MTGAVEWTFLTNYGHVLICIARDPDIRIKDIADLVGITERAAHRIVTDLVEQGYLIRAKVGRRNQYKVAPNRPMRHPVERDHSVDELLSVLRPPGRARSARPSR